MKNIFQYIMTFIASFLIGLFAAKFALPVAPTYATADIAVNETSNNLAEQKSAIEEYALGNIAAPVTSTPNYSANTTSSNVVSTGLYMPSIGFYSSVSTAAISGNTVQVPAYGVARTGNLLVGHNPGTFSAILNIHNGDVFYLDGQAYQVYNVQILNVSNNMRFVGQETTSSLSNGSKGLVLMTCYGEMKTFSNGITSASQRFIVYAKAV